MPALVPPPVSSTAAVTRHVAPWTEVSGPTPLQAHKREQWQHSLRRAHEIGDRLAPSGSVRPVEAVQQRILARLRGTVLSTAVTAASVAAEASEVKVLAQSMAAYQHAGEVQVLAQSMAANKHAGEVKGPAQSMAAHQHAEEAFVLAQSMAAKQHVREVDVLAQSMAAGQHASVVQVLAQTTAASSLAVSAPFGGGYAGTGGCPVSSGCPICLGVRPCGEFD